MRAYKKIKRRISMLLTAILIIGNIGATGVAAQAADNNRFITIDSAHAYEGMKTSFEKGYEPVVKDDTMRLVVPFLSETELKNKNLTVMVEFDSKKSAPFYYKNYCKTVKQTEKGLYLYTSKLKLDEDRVNGKYPVRLKVQGETAQGQQFTEYFTIYVEIADGVDSAEKLTDSEDVMNSMDTGMDEEGVAGESTGIDSGISGESATQETANHQPRLLLESNNLMDHQLEAGKSYELSLVIRNCSKTSAIENAKVRIQTEETGLELAQSSYYYERVAAGQTMTLTQQITVARNVPMGNVPLQLTIDYDDALGTVYTESETILLQVVQVPEVTLADIVFPESVYGAETDALTIQIQNSGLMPIYNAKVTIESGELSPTKDLVVGTLEAGSAQDGELLIFINRQDSEQYEARGTVILTYEDSNGQVYTQEQEIGTTILQPQTLKLQVEEKPETNQWGTTIVIGIVLLLILVIICVLVRLQYYKKRVLAYEK